MQYILPVTIGDTQLISTTATEDALPAWAAGTNWSTGAQVTRLSRHEIYERLAPGGVDAAAPETDATKWLFVGYTNSRRMFDERVGSVTTATGSLTVVIRPGVVVRGLALLELDCDAIQVTMTAGGATVYSHTAAASANRESATTFYDWCFSAIERRRGLVLTDLPPYSEGEITVTITGSGTVSVGACIVGPLNDIGGTQYGLSTGITDYSVRTKDKYGVYTLKEGDYSRKATIPIEFLTGHYDSIDARLIKARAKFCVWIGSENYNSTVIYGLLSDWYLTLPGPAKSTGHLEIDGTV